MKEKTVTPEDLANIAGMMQTAQEDETPVAVVDPGSKELSIVGDPNKTEKKVTSGYTIRFRLPKKLFGNEVPANAKDYGNSYSIDVTYDDVDINPRNDTKIVGYVLQIKPFFEKLLENGEVVQRKPEEIIKLLANAEDYDDIMLSIYNLIGTFLGIDDNMGKWMMSFSVISAFEKLIQNYPEIFNEADYFFD